MSEIRDIEKAFIQLLVDMELSPLATENAPMDIEGLEGPWYRFSSNPGMPTRPGIGAEGNQRFVGILDVDVYWPRSQGDDAAKTKADEIAAGIPVGTVIGRGVVTRCSRLPAAIHDGKWYVVPVQAAYRVDSISEGETENG